MNYTRVAVTVGKRNTPQCSMHRPHHQLLYVNKNKVLTPNFYDADQKTDAQTGQSGLFDINGLTPNFYDAGVLQDHGFHNDLLGVFGLNVAHAYA